MVEKDRRGEASGVEGTGATAGSRGTGRGPHARGSGGFQLDPGLKGWRLYIIEWSNLTQFAQIVATNTAYGSYEADEEYWYVDQAEVGQLDSGLVIRIVGDYDWVDQVPSPPSGYQEFNTPIGATWEEVKSDLSVGTLYKLDGGDFYLRLQNQGSSPNATLSLVRWYQGDSLQPTGPFNPSGTYEEVTSLGTGNAWYADSLSPP